MWVIFKVHSTTEEQGKPQKKVFSKLVFLPLLANFENSLDHVENGAIFVEPNVMIGYCHSLERDFLGVFEKTIGSPNEAEPLDR